MDKPIELLLKERIRENRDLIDQLAELEDENKKLKVALLEADKGILAYDNCLLFFVKLHQKNYKEFADYCPSPPLLEMSEQEKEYYHSIAERFSTVQGFTQRQYVEELSKEEYVSKPSFSNFKTARQTRQSIAPLIKEINKER